MANTTTKRREKRIIDGGISVHIKECQTSLLRKCRGTPGRHPPEGGVIPIFGSFFCIFTSCLEFQPKTICVLGIVNHQKNGKQW